MLSQYSDSFRDLINARVWESGESPDKALRLNKKSDWSFICVAMDVVGDASTAIGDFLCFGLEGPTKHDSVGERYLRLYGLLSATYIQQEAILKLYKLMNCSEPSDVRKELDGLIIRTLRHQVASHSVDYRPTGGGEEQAFVPVRLGLRNRSCQITKNRGDGSYTVDLDKAVLEHCKLLSSLVDRIYEKSIGTIFRGRQDQIKQFNERLSDLRFVADGNIIVKAGDSPDSPTIRVICVDSGGNYEDDT